MKLSDLDLPDKKDVCSVCSKPKSAFWHEPHCNFEGDPKPHKFISIKTAVKRERRRAEEAALEGCPDPQAFVDAVRELQARQVPGMDFSKAAQIVLDLKSTESLSWLKAAKE